MSCSGRVSVGFRYVTASMYFDHVNEYERNKPGGETLLDAGLQA